MARLRQIIPIEKTNSKANTTFNQNISFRFY